ncbi:MAG: ASKHA domain-containing protein, partial [Defluviitaleaceae bacterium]|nr:ASKHA domain-containing protein [Defluviitaleaceae bacterium]
KNIRQLAVSGNTTMLHLLLGTPCHSLGQFPFTAAFTGIKRYGYREIFGSNEFACGVTLLPGISAYVGADVAAGLVFCDTAGPKPVVLIDLGTNGEMALVDRSRGLVLVTSTAAGPAFEAGNIGHGVGSVPGAIAKVSFDPARRVYDYETIGDAFPIGLCGTGVVDAAAQLVRHGFADETGLFSDEFFDEGVLIAPEAGIRFTQKDMREVQLAKSAVRSGLEVLLIESGLCYGDIGKVYLAGGFGYKIDLESACSLGIIPEELRSKVAAVGNSSLGGCARVLVSKKAEAEIMEIAEMAVEIGLSTHPRFNDLFMENMMF